MLPLTIQIIEGVASQGVEQSAQLEGREGLCLADSLPKGAFSVGFEIIVRKTDFAPCSHDERRTTLCRSSRTTAGQHSDLYYLPRAVGEIRGRSTGASEMVSNAISVLFRPWS